MPCDARRVRENFLSLSASWRTFGLVNFHVKYCMDGFCTNYLFFIHFHFYIK